MDDSTLALSLCFAAFVLTFLVTRVVTRLIRAGRGPFKDNVSAAGLHVHHAIPGLFLLLAGAVTSIASSAQLFRYLAAFAVGAGASLVLDEFALILHLQDVYWTKQGQASVQAVVLAGVCLLLLLLGFQPLSSSEFTGGLPVLLPELGLWGSLIWASVICARKGKYRVVLLSIFLVFPAYFGAIRLARPGSPWFRVHYPPGSAKEIRAVERSAQFDQRWGGPWTRFANLIAGAPNEEVPTDSDQVP